MASGLKAIGFWGPVDPSISRPELGPRDPWVRFCAEARNAEAKSGDPFLAPDGRSWRAWRWTPLSILLITVATAPGAMAQQDSVPDNLCWGLSSPASCRGSIVTDLRVQFYLQPTRGSGVVVNLGYMHAVTRRSHAGVALRLAYDDPNELWPGITGRYRYWLTDRQSVEGYAGLPVAGDASASEPYLGVKYSPVPAFALVTELQLLEQGTGWAVGGEVGGAFGTTLTAVAAVAFAVLAAIVLAGQ